MREYWLVFRLAKPALVLLFPAFVLAQPEAKLRDRTIPLWPAHVSSSTAKLEFLTTKSSLAVNGQTVSRDISYGSDVVVSLKPGLNILTLTALPEYSTSEISVQIDRESLDPNQLREMTTGDYDDEWYLDLKVQYLDFNRNHHLRGHEKFIEAYNYVTPAGSRFRGMELKQLKHSFQYTTHTWIGEPPRLTQYDFPIVFGRARPIKPAGVPRPTRPASSPNKPPKFQLTRIPSTGLTPEELERRAQKSRAATEQYRKDAAAKEAYWRAEMRKRYKPRKPRGPGPCIEV